MNQTEQRHHQYPAAMVNITNRCTLSCRHCFIYRQSNPNDRRAEMDTETMLRKLADLQERHGIQHMLWMGGEPLLRPDVLQKGVALFVANTVIKLKKNYPDFIWNKTRGLELTRSENALAVAANCPSKQLVLPLYLEDGEFVTPFCCHGNDVDCDLCGSWVVFHLAARLEYQN